MKYRSARKPKKCPVCGSSKIASYLYGMPIYDEKLQEDMDSGKIVIGGCCITDDDPQWKCLACKEELYKI